MQSDSNLPPFVVSNVISRVGSAGSEVERAVARWVRRRLHSLRHERRVLALADALFDLLRPLHRLGPSARRTLRLAALVHDVGRAIDDRRHPQLGARMLLSERRLPLSARQRRWLAYLTRYHRGAVPAVGFDDVLTGSDPRKAARILLAIFRAADALDGRQHHPPRIRFKLRGRRLKIRVELIDDCRRARRFFSRRKKFRLLEEELRLTVIASIKPAAPSVVD